MFLPDPVSHVRRQALDGLLTPKRIHILWLTLVRLFLTFSLNLTCRRCKSKGNHGKTRRRVGCIAEAIYAGADGSPRHAAPTWQLVRLAPRPSLHGMRVGLLVSTLRYFSVQGGSQHAYPRSINEYHVPSADRRIL